MVQPNFAPAAYGRQPQRPQQPFYNAQQPQQWGQQPQPYMEQLQFQPQPPALTEMFGGAQNAHEQSRQQAYQSGLMQPPPGYASPANQATAQGRRARGLDAADEMNDYILGNWHSLSEQQQNEFMNSRYWDNLSEAEQKRLLAKPGKVTRRSPPAKQQPVQQQLSLEDIMGMFAPGLAQGGAPIAAVNPREQAAPFFNPQQPWMW